jgi:hypothetical protein
MLSRGAGRKSRGCFLAWLEKNPTRVKLNRHLLAFRNLELHVISLAGFIRNMLAGENI